MTKYEIRKEQMSPFGTRFVVYLDGRRWANCSSETSAKKLIAQRKSAEKAA